MTQSRMFGWLALAAPITLLAGLIYATVQQDYRQTANDPQIQMAEDTATLLNKGVPPVSILASNFITNVADSLAPFTIVYDQDNKVVASSAKLDGTAPTLPTGVLTETKAKGQDRLTWQPKTGVRIAAVAQRYNGGVVLVGRSLREVEKRESNLSLMVAIGWLTSLISSAVFYLLKG